LSSAKKSPFQSKKVAYINGLFLSFAPLMKTFEQLRIVFFGTPDFAVASLDALVLAGANIVGVVTAPDKPAGRSMHLTASAVKQYAVDKGLPLLQPEKMKAPEFLEQLTALNADIQVVVAFRMMPEVVWNMPPMGTINVHGSLLPQYRGAAPINWAIINGETESGVTTFKLKHEIDTGDILLQQKVPIRPSDNAGTMHDKLMAAGAALLVTTIRGLADGTLPEIPQSQAEAGDLKHAPKIFKEHLLIDWTKPVTQIDNLVRGMSPYPAAYTMLGGKTLKIFSSDFLLGATNALPGIHETDNATYLRFAAKDGWLYVDEVQLEGKKRMSVVDFLRGFRG
jgi:methionyl-tRNA formyltransferase